MRMSAKRSPMHAVAESNFDMAFLDPKLGVLRKNFHFLELVVEPKGNWNLTVDVVINSQTSGAIWKCCPLVCDRTPRSHKYHTPWGRRMR